MATFIRIPEGTFNIGAIETDTLAFENEFPCHNVTVKKFELSDTLVTVGDFQKFTLSTGYKTDAEKGEGAFSFCKKSKTWIMQNNSNWRTPFVYTDDTVPMHQDKNHPVTCLSWNDACAYLQWLNREADSSSEYFSLPTEEQWEYASSFNIPKQKLHEDIYCNLIDRAWFIENTQGAGTKIVKCKKPNELGLYDMLGNVYEWTSSNFVKYGTDLSIEEGALPSSLKVMRGGSFMSKARGLRITDRSGTAPFKAYCDIGFRVAKYN